LDVADFDAKELLYLAMNASNKGDKEAAIDFYKRSNELDCTAETTYLLATEYADLKYYEKAIERMAEALAMRPELVTASIQLCLLYLIVGMEANASAVVEAMVEPKDPQLLSFIGYKRGLAALLAGDQQCAIDHLSKGIADEVNNMALARDMQLIVNNLSATEELEQQPADDQSEEVSDYLLSKYRSNEFSN
jgi:tetratricopeptide (TPR) repeat protein